MTGEITPTNHKIPPIRKNKYLRFPVTILLDSWYIFLVDIMGGSVSGLNIQQSLVVLYLGTHILTKIDFN